MTVLGKQSCWDTANSSGEQSSEEFGAYATCKHSPMQRSRLWCWLMEGYAEQWPDPANEITSWKAWEEGSNQLQLLGLLECIYRQEGRDPEKVVSTDTMAQKLWWLDTVTNIPLVSPDNLVGCLVDQGVTYMYHTVRSMPEEQCQISSMAKDNTEDMVVWLNSEKTSGKNGNSAYSLPTWWDFWMFLKEKEEHMTEQDGSPFRDLALQIKELQEEGRGQFS